MAGVSCGGSAEVAEVGVEHVDFVEYRRLRRFCGGCGSIMGKLLITLAEVCGGSGYPTCGGSPPLKGGKPPGYAQSGERARETPL